MERVIEALDQLGVYHTLHPNENGDGKWYALVEFHTDYAGQDIPTEFEFDGTAEDFVRTFYTMANTYDVDEEVEIYVPMRGQNGTPWRVMDIVRDCEEAKETLMNIAEKLKEAL